MTSQHPTRAPLAIVGVSALFPGSSDAAGFWSDIRRGVDLIGEVPPTHWLPEDYYDPDPKAPDKTYARRGGFLSHVDFDPIAWGVPPKLIRATDTSQLLGLIVAEQVLRDAARTQFTTMDRSRISVILGVTSAQELLAPMVSRLQKPVWVKSLREHGVPEDEVQEICQRIADHYVPWEESSFPGLLGNVVAGRIANRLDLGGTNCVTDAACASTFAALNMAAQELYMGDSELVITGGVDTLNDIFMFMCFSKTPALSPTGDCRPFSDQADGTMLGEGLGMVALKRLDQAERDGDHIYAVIRGLGSSSDGRSKSVYAPASAGQARALRRAHERAGIEAHTVELIEAHGTGTKAGDAAEFAGLCMVFSSDESRPQSCALGSVKSQIGHTKAAAGAAGLFKAAMAVHHKVLPPTIKIERPNPKLELERSPFYLNTEARPWIRGSDHPRRAGVSAFGFGGSNFHVVLEEYTGPGEKAARLRALSAELVVISGASGAEVASQARAWAQRRDEQGILEWAAWDSQHSFKAEAPARLAVVASDGEELATKLERAAAQIEAAPDRSYESPDGSAYGVGELAGGIGLLFPGQGSQYLGMTAELAMSFDAAREPWDRAADHPFTGVGSPSCQGERVDQRVFPIPRFDGAAREADELALRETQWAQPAIGVASLSLLAMLRELGIVEQAAAVAGHSFGEVTALHAAGVLSEADLLRVARRRGELMAAAGASGAPGAMSAVTASAEQVREVLAGIEGVVLANLNAPNQTVISGTREAIDAAEAALERAGLAVRRLPVASGFHSPVVSASVGPFLDFLSTIEFGEARVPVYSGEIGAPYEAQVEAQRARLGRQIAEPVRFTTLVEAMAEAGVRTFIEVGPGAVLTGLVDTILAGRAEVAAVALDRRKAEGLSSLLRGLARLAARGVAMSLDALWRGYAPPRDPATRSAAKLAVPLCGSNAGKPYPPPGGAADLPPPNPRPAPTVTDMSDAKLPPPGQSPSHAPTLASPASTPAATHVQSAGATPAPVPVTIDGGWLAAWQEAQRQLAQTHAAVTQSMADSHAAYLRTSEAGLAGLAAMAGVRVPQPSARAELGPIAPTSHAPAHAYAPAPPQMIPAPAPMAPAPSPMAPAPSPMAPAPSQPVARPQPSTPDLPASPPGLATSPASAPSPSAPAAAAAPAVDLEAIMLEVVADKTGYPAEMLELSMDMEAELGIDSIKRVEILAAVQDQAPGLPEVDANHMGTLRTLGEIVTYMQGLLGAAPAPAAAASASEAVSAAAPAVDLEAIMLEVVADKTGYPAEMLELSMDMEAELGIDSIKRVEILAAVQDQAPGLPEVDANHMGTLRTLGEIVTYMQGLLGGEPGPAKAPGAAASTAAAPGPVEAPAPAAELGRYALELVPAPAVGLAQAGLHQPGGVVITSDGQGIAEALAAELGRRGLSARVVSEVPEDAGALVFLGGLREVKDEDQAIAINREAFHAARALAPRLSREGGLFVTVQDTGGGFGLEPCPPLRAYLAGVPALIKTAKQEWPEASLKSVDIDGGGRSAQAIAEALADELLLGGGELEVALAATGERRTLRSIPAPLNAGRAGESEGRDQRFVDGEVIVVSGGARGVTAGCVVEWARRLAPSITPRFVLLGRTSLELEPTLEEAVAGIHDDAGLKRALLAHAQAQGVSLTPAELSRRARAVASSREIRATLSALDEAGAQARYLSVDVTDRAALDAALAEVRRELGPIAGLVHAAGVLADKRIAELDDEHFDRVFDTKIAGLRALLSATAGDSLRALCLFSSVSARCGNNGQAAYAMANEVLNKVAQSQARQRECTGGPEPIVRALDWGPWEGGMVSPQLREHFARLGVPMIPLDTGAHMFADELCAARPNDPREVEVVLGGEPRPEALIAKGSEARVLELEVHLDRSTHGYLADHSIAGTVVVPVVLATEWFSRIARAFRPDLHLRSLGKVEVLRGIKLHGFDQGGDRLTLRCRQLQNGDGALLGLELLGAEGSLHYRAEATMAKTSSALAAEGAPRPSLRAWGDATVYGDVLFHGHDFQVIESLEGVGAEGIAGTLKGVRKAGWKWEPWQTDVAALDGGLQLAVLWARGELGGAALPMGFDELRIGERPVSEGPIHVVASCRKTGKTGAVADLVFVDDSGVRVSELLGTKLVLRPDQHRVPQA